MRKIFLPTKYLVSPEDQGADFVELFFDLVFVYAITRITAMTAHHLDILHVAQSVSIFWLIWLGWSQFTWALNSANTNLAEVRLTVLIATGVAFMMASFTDHAFDKGVFWFALPYMITRTIGLVLYIRVTPNVDGQRSTVITFALLSVFGLLAVLAGAFVSPELRLWFWLAAIGLDMIAGIVGARSESWNILPKHFAERHGLIVIIALGESLIVAAAAISNQDRSQEIILVGGLAVLVTCLLWWSYFAWTHEHLEEYFSNKSGSELAKAARDSFSYMHFPLIFGIIGVAIGFEIILLHPHELLSSSTAIALGGGVFLFIFFTGLSVWRMSKLVLLPRLLILLVSSAGLIFTVGRPPIYALGVISIALTLMVMIEWKQCRIR